MSEKWATIEEFPNYEVSSFGRIRNSSTGRIMRTSRTKTGNEKITLANGHDRQTRFVRVLVAKAFVKKINEFHNTVVLLDNNPQNLYASNLVWRPRQYAWAYSDQFVGLYPFSLDRLIKDVDSGVVYKSVKEASMALGVLAIDVYHSAQYNRRTKVTGHQFSWLG